MAEDTAQTGDTETTTDHETVREWVESRGSTAAQVLEPSGDDPGTLAIVPEDAEDDSVEKISWDDFFEIFEDEELAFVYQEDKDDPEEQWFCKFVDRDQEITDDIFADDQSGSTWGAGQQYAERTSEQEGTTAGAAVESSSQETTSETTIEEGDVAETEVTRTETIEKEIVETDRIQSRVVTSNVVEQNVIDSSVVDRELESCQLMNETTVENEVVETRRVSEEVFESYTVESEVIDSETIERDLSEGSSPEGTDAEPTAEGRIDLDDSGLTHESIVESEIVRQDIERGDLREGEVLESEVVERRVIETEVEERILLSTDIETGESIDSRTLERDLVESEIVERETAEEGFGSDTESTETMGETNESTDTSGADRAAGGGAGSGADVSDDDAGKSVVNTYGEEIGIVAEVRDGTLYVDPEPGMTEKISSKLGWGDADDDAYPIEADQIETITDDEVKISQL